MTSRDELTEHLLLSYVATHHEEVLRELVENPTATLEMLGLSAAAMRCPPRAHRALSRADGAVVEVEALGELDPVQAMPTVADTVSRHFASPFRLEKIPFGVRFLESLSADDGEEGEPDYMTGTATATVECRWGLSCGSDVDG